MTELNGTGLFLEAAVHNILSKNSEYKVLREEPYSGYTSESFEGVIDLLLVRLLQSAGRIVCLAVECKKADQAQKKWVIERWIKSDESSYPFDYFEAGVNNFNFNKNIFFPSLGYGGIKFFDQGIQTFEFNENSGKLSRNQGERPYLALKQANEAISSFEDERKNRIYEIAGVNFRQYDILFIPIVITTADLLLLDYNPEKIDLSKGEIDIQEVKLNPKDWIHYEFPLPYSLRTRAQGGLGPVKRPSFIVSAGKCEEFIEKLIKDSESYVLQKGQ
ncbi:hypothetical protein HY439_00620 [Candidatus Microgenomates bacterium]|nr:hypothetical protein [Candidatus Microgenomates bacterium]